MDGYISLQLHNINMQ